MEDYEGDEFHWVAVRDSAEVAARNPTVKKTSNTSFQFLGN